MFNGPPVLLLQREELTEVILKLLVAWRDPLWHFHQSIAHHHDFNNFSSNKALEMSDMVHELRKGVQKVAEKVPYFLYNAKVWGKVYMSPAGPTKTHL